MDKAARKAKISPEALNSPLAMGRLASKGAPCFGAAVGRRNAARPTTTLADADPAGWTLIGPDGLNHPRGLPQRVPIGEAARDENEQRS